MVVGHYGCGGVQAVAEKRSAGLADNWLRHIDDIAYKHATWIDSAACDEDRSARLAELNVIEQVANVGQTTIVRDAWSRGHQLSIHGWIYGLADGLVRDLSTTVSSSTETATIYHAALTAL